MLIVWFGIGYSSKGLSSARTLVVLHHVSSTRCPASVCGRQGAVATSPRVMKGRTEWQIFMKVDGLPSRGRAGSSPASRSACRSRWSGVIPRASFLGVVRRASASGFNAYSTGYNITRRDGDRVPDDGGSCCWLDRDQQHESRRGCCAGRAEIGGRSSSAQVPDAREETF